VASHVSDSTGLIVEHGRGRIRVDARHALHLHLADGAGSQDGLAPKAASEGVGVGDHGLMLASSLEQQQLLCVEGERSYRVTPLGSDWFRIYFAVDVVELARNRRPLARRCLDWTERRPHLAGALGALLLERRWLTRVEDSRCLRVSPRGAAELARLGVGAPASMQSSAVSG
jgi:hypothetical protein